MAGRRYCRVATCNLNQWALDFDGNRKRILQSIEEAKRQGATYRLGPELEVPGYGCEDHFLEIDTIDHSWQSLAEVLKSGVTNGILCDLGLPALHRGVRYNCRVFCLDGRVVLIRPKMHLADDGNYRESRWFTAWPRGRAMEEFRLPPCIQGLSGQRSAPIGFGIVQANDCSVASEVCEELWSPDSPHIALGLAGVEIISNASGSHHQLRKLDTRINLMQSASAKCGGVYMYANQQGCDGGRLYFDGCALVFCGGDLLARTSQFSMRDVEVTCAVVDLGAVQSARAAIVSRSIQAAQADDEIGRVDVDFAMCGVQPGVGPSPRMEMQFHTPEEEVGMGPACWLWDYMRRSGAAGFLLPFSGGADSASTAAIVALMCTMVFEAVQAGDEAVLSDLRAVVRDPAFAPEKPQDITNRIMHTVYLSTSNSGEATRRRAQAVADDTGMYHMNVEIDQVISAVLGVFSAATGKVPQFAVRGGSRQEDLALQNIQARSRMVLSYLFAQMLPWVRGQQGFLLVLGSANVDEGLRGYMTKYDCSSADLNPIGSISKLDLRQFLTWASDRLECPTMREIAGAPPTAELVPMADAAAGAGADADAGAAGQAAAEHSQTDEEDMGMTYEELGWFGRLRKLGRCGPVSMYERLVAEWDLSPTAVSEKVKRFFFYYGINRHKMTTITPSYHAENYSPDDNRFDLRQFLYPRWEMQFRQVDEMAASAERATAAAGSGGPAVDGDDLA